MLLNVSCYRYHYLLLGMLSLLLLLLPLLVVLCCGIILGYLTVVSPINGACNHFLSIYLFPFHEFCAEKVKWPMRKHTIAHGISPLEPTVYTAQRPLQRSGQGVPGSLQLHIRNKWQRHWDRCPSVLPGESSWADATWHWVLPHGTGTILSSTLWPHSSLAEGMTFKGHFYTSCNWIPNPPASFTRTVVLETQLKFVMIISYFFFWVVTYH